MITCDERLTYDELSDDEQARVSKYQEESGYGVLEMVRDNKQKIVPTLINGKQVDRAQWQEVVRIGARSCTGTFVGKNCVITAAHCGRNNSVSSLEIYGTDGTLKTYRYRMIHHPRWRNQSNWDLAILALDDEVDITPARVGIDYVFANGKDVDLLGYGCTRPGGSGGNDGILRFGESKVQGFTGTDVITSWRPSGGALCFGDSGGPMFADGSNSGGQRTLIAVNSKGNIRDTNYNMRLDLEDARSWLENI
ncbi:MAG: trypsin-like serine protease, partial [Planctomycetota bacterium]